MHGGLLKRRAPSSHAPGLCGRSVPRRCPEDTTHTCSVIGGRKQYRSKAEVSRATASSWSRKPALHVSEEQSWRRAAHAARVTLSSPAASKYASRKRVEEDP